MKTALSKFLYTQMFSYRSKASYKTNTNTQRDTHWNKVGEHCLHRQKCQKLRQRWKALCHIHHRFIIDKVHCNQWQKRTNHPNHHTLNHKWRSRKKIRRANILHNLNLLFSDRDTNGYCIANKKDGYQK